MVPAGQEYRERGEKMTRYRWVVLWLAVMIMVNTPFVQADDWPQFRGPDRDGKSKETGLLKTWPEGGPKLIKTITGIGAGYSSPAIAGGKIYISGKVVCESCKVGDELFLFCFDMEGKKLWGTKLGPAFARSYKGARSTPTVKDGIVCVLSGIGQLGVFDAASGKQIWSKDILKTFKGKFPSYGVSESVLIDGDRVICTPGGKDACIVALDKKTGDTVWTSKGVNNRCDYASPILVEHNKAKQVVALAFDGLIGVSAKDGTLLWRYDKPFGKGRMCLTPVYENGCVFAEAGHKGMGGAVKLTAKGADITVTPLWEVPATPTHLGGYIALKGHIYGHDGTGFSCREFQSGKVAYQEKSIAKGSTLYADGMFYCLGENGVMQLVQADTSGCKKVSVFKMPEARRNVWAYPAIADKRLFIRYSDKVFIYDIKK